MADADKLQRLKAAKKKVKEHKLKLQKEANQHKEEETSEEPVLFNTESLTNSVHSSNGEMVHGVNQFASSENSVAVTNYFRNTATIDPIAFFDNLPIANESEPENVFSTFSNNASQNSTPARCEDNDVGYIEYPELNVNEVRENNVPETNTSSNVISESGAMRDFQRFDTITFDNAESLRQLSTQMTQLVDLNSTDFTVPHVTSDLEKRNQELAHLLNNEKMTTEQLLSDVEMYKAKVSRLEEESRRDRDEFERKISAELGPLREQLQTHMQTVGILVGEKSELSASLSQAQLMLKQKCSENEELNGRLKTSRSRVADLEKELNNLRTERNQNDLLDTMQVAKLKQYDALKKEKEEADQDISELRGKLDAVGKDNANTLKELQEAKAQLSLAEIKIQQLTAGESMQTGTQVETLTQEKLLLEKRFAELDQTVKTMILDRDQSSHQYQQYVQQLNGQLNALAQKLESVTEDNETLSKREQDLVKHIGELERHLQNLQNEHLNNAIIGTKSENNNASESLEKLKLEKSKLEANFEEVRSERDELLKELVEKKGVIEDLEGQMERLRVDQPDNAKLLATIESDKVAAARAVSQNKLLKDQLEEMQNAFIKMSNDKMELTEQLETEKHQSRDLTEKLQTTEQHLSKLADAIEIKDRELTEMRNMAETNHEHEDEGEETAQADKQLLQFNQLEDRLRHYEAQEHSYHALEFELREARSQIDALQARLTNNHTEDREKHEEGRSCYRENNNEIIVDSMNRDLAMKRLEEKFMKTMTDIANLQDEKQSLEHLVLQLQGETETIGEYIMLYQHQRAVLKQRAVEKEDQLKRLAADREEMRNKLEKLNLLIERLVKEKNAEIPAEILEQQSNLCLEHAQMRKDTVTNGAPEESSRETAERIIELLSEIKTSSLVQADENFHPCPWCSGQLINI